MLSSSMRQAIPRSPDRGTVRENTGFTETAGEKPLHDDPTDARLDLFPTERQPLIRQSLAFNLKAILCQRLLPAAKEGVKMVPAVEVLFNNSTGKFECGSDQTSFFGTGNVLTLGDARYVKKSGDTMTGALTIYRQLGFREIPAYYANPLPDVVYLGMPLP